MKHIILEIIWPITLVTVIIWLVLTGLTMPMVTLSHSAWAEADYLSDNHASDRELNLASCVKVEPHSAGSCTNLPRKYATQWSK